MLQDEFPDESGEGEESMDADEQMLQEMDEEGEDEASEELDGDQQDGNEEEMVSQEGEPVFDDMGEEGEEEEEEMATNIEAKREKAISDLLKKEDLGLI